MLPPIDDAVLQSNPEFATLYNTLTTAVLNDDGSTMNDPSSKERDATREEDGNKHIIRSPLIQPIQHEHRPAPPAPHRPPPPPPTPRLPPDRPGPPTPLDAATLDLLLTSPPLSDLPALLPHLWPLLSASLQTSALSLARHAHPSTNPSYLHRHLPTLGPSIASSTAALSASKRDLTRARLDAAAAVADLQADVYSPDASAALAAYAAHLRDSRVRLAEGCRSRLAELAEYGVVVPEEGDDGGGGGDEQNVSAKERTMREMARVFGEMEREMEDIQRDLERLGRA
ncbi:hypothetical protein GGTG_04524 [Gaeumannomyces tritici R3-111a-1]|uniref:Uncharacterized protein n=1 Tax=Gaeumannomyces tritici (strain R3-111a-1) TaxID=644352 RepID=J3NTC5_GAET3|nr:hypothetical protein GGTG_04524 [Gaeumannomyces tritici R3-111a-1]EJT79440.1 hypothetical protein GGTG_04524 [Gaeumannomyces tritici R3-111a-1]